MYKKTKLYLPQRWGSKSTSCENHRWATIPLRNSLNCPEGTYGTTQHLSSTTGQGHWFFSLKARGTGYPAHTELAGAQSHTCTHKYTNIRMHWASQGSHTTVWGTQARPGLPLPPPTCSLGGLPAQSGMVEDSQHYFNCFSFSPFQTVGNTNKRRN